MLRRAAAEVDQHRAGRLPDKQAVDRRGEEGEVTFLGAEGEERLALKEWYTTHVSRLLEIATGRKIPTAPFLFKTRFYQAALIHDLFPTHTIAIAHAYDLRHSKDYQGKREFRAKVDAPVTVSRLVVGDSAGQADCDAILSAAYQEIHQIHAQREPLQEHDPINMQRLHDVVVSAEEDIIKRFGPELRDPVYHSGAMSQLPYQAAETAYQYAKAHYPESMVTKMLRYGIAPAHPEFNFIPGNPDHFPVKPHGTFVEMVIIDPDRCRDVIMQEHRAPSGDITAEGVNLLHKLRRYEIFTEMDTAYNDCLKNVRAQAIIDSPFVQQALYEALLSYQMYLEQFNPTELLFYYRRQFSLALLEAHTVDAAMTNLRRLGTTIEAEGRIRQVRNIIITWARQGSYAIHGSTHRSSQP